MWIGGSFYCKLDKKVHWNTENIKVLVYRSMKMDQTPENSIDKSESQTIYTYMACMSYNVETPRIHNGDSSKLTNWILDSGET